MQFKETSYPTCAKWLCTIWDNMTYVEISGPHKCTPVSYTNRKMLFGTQLEVHEALILRSKEKKSCGPMIKEIPELTTQKGPFKLL